MKTKLTFLIALLALTVACKNETTAVDPQKQEEFFVKAAFLYSDGTQEETRIKTLRFDKNARVNQNLVVDGVVEITRGDFNNVEIKNNAVLTISGIVSISNINFINNQDVKVIVKHSAELSVGALNLNGRVEFTNYGKVFSKSLELQGGKNTFHNYGSHLVVGDIQLSSGNSKYTNCGQTTIIGNMQVHAGEYEACNCGSLITSGLSINAANKVSGKGFIKVIENFNLNQNFTSSPDIEFCYDKNINQPSRLGSAKRTCEPSCKPDALPLRYSDLKVESSVDKEGNWIGKISFNVTENSGLDRMKLLVSSDGIIWTVNYTEHADAFNVGEKYSREFFVRLK